MWLRLVSNAQPLARRQKCLEVAAPNTHVVGVKAVALRVIFLALLLSSMLPLMSMCDILMAGEKKKTLFPAKCKKQHTPFLSWPGLAWDERPPGGEAWGGPLGEAVPERDRRQRWKRTPGRGSSENAGFSRGGRAAGDLFLLQPTLSVVVLTVGAPSFRVRAQGGLD